MCRGGGGLMTCMLGKTDQSSDFFFFLVLLFVVHGLAGGGFITCWYFVCYLRSEQSIFVGFVNCIFLCCCVGGGVCK